MKKLLMAMVVAAGILSVGLSCAHAGADHKAAGKQIQDYSLAIQTATPSSVPDPDEVSSPFVPTNPFKLLSSVSQAHSLRSALAAMLLSFGALPAYFGLGGGATASMVSIVLVIGLIALLLALFWTLIMRLFRGKSQGDSAAARMPETDSRIEPQLHPAEEPVEPAMADGRDAFDSQAFLRSAETCFIRLQAAWDHADIADIREFTTPEMFDELSRQLRERGATADHTDVVSLDADLLGLEVSGGDYAARVRFSGTIKEAEQAPAEPFTEIWNLTKPISGQGDWILASIQQVS